MTVRIIDVVSPLLIVLLMSLSLSAQQVTFKLQGSEQIRLTNETGSLDFNELAGGLPFFMAGAGGVTVDLTQNRGEIVIIRLEAPGHLDVAIDVAATPMSLVCSTGCPSPLPNLEFQLGWAFWNRSVSDDLISVPPVDQLVSGAIEVLSPGGLPLAYGSAIFPVRRRSFANAAPAPPPVPDHDGYVNVPSTSAFIMVYGRLGDIPDGLQSGSYSATITVDATVPIYP